MATIGGKEITGGQASNIIENLSEDEVEVSYTDSDGLRTDELDPETAATYWKEATAGLGDTDYEGPLPDPSGLGAVYEGTSYVDTAPVKLEVNQDEALTYTVSTELEALADDAELSMSAEIPFDGSTREMKTLARSSEPDVGEAYMEIVSALT